MKYMESPNGYIEKVKNNEVSSLHKCGWKIINRTNNSKSFANKILLATGRSTPC